MRLLLDTHIAVWAALAPDALTEAERKELLLVQAQEEGICLLTCDAKLVGHPFAVGGE